MSCDEKPVVCLTAYIPCQSAATVIFVSTRSICCSSLPSLPTRLKVFFCFLLFYVLDVLIPHLRPIIQLSALTASNSDADARSRRAVSF